VDRKQELAFEKFVAESGDDLLRLATLLMSDRGLGEDLYQETLHRLAARWSRVDSPRAYCRQVMHNIVIDQVRARQRQVPEIRLAEAYDNSDPRADDPASAAELRPALLAALRTLTPQQRTIVVLRYFDDRSENGATLESAWSSPGEFDEDLYLSTTYSNTIPADPYQG